MIEWTYTLIHIMENHFIKDIMPSVIDELLRKKLAVDDEGAKVVFLVRKIRYFLIVQKKDGAFLYSTSDIATIKFKKENYERNKLIYITDERQQDHFKQFFKITDMLGWDIEKHHIWFELWDLLMESSTCGGKCRIVGRITWWSSSSCIRYSKWKKSWLLRRRKQNIVETVKFSKICWFI